MYTACINVRWMWFTWSMNYWDIKITDIHASIDERKRIIEKEAAERLLHMLCWYGLQFWLYALRSKSDWRSEIKYIMYNCSTTRRWNEENSWLFCTRSTVFLSLRSKGSFAISKNFVRKQRFFSDAFGESETIGLRGVARTCWNILFFREKLLLKF